MRRSRMLATVAVGMLWLAVVFAQPPGGGLPPLPTPNDPFAPPPPSSAKAKPEPKPEDIGWEVCSPDGKVHKFTPLDDSLTLETKYGTVKVPMKEVKRVEFGMRLSDDNRRKIADAVADVVGGGGRTREAGKEALIELGLAAYPSVERAMKTAPRDTLPHLSHVRDKLARLVGDEDDDPLDRDVIVTTDGSRLCGSLTPATVRVRLGGEAKVIGWAEARVLAFGGILVDEKVDVVTLGPNGIFGLMQTHFDKVVGVEVTGVAQGSVWGSNPYTLDSYLGAAAVHAGVIQVGETAVVKIKVKADAGGYTGSTKNGVTTNNWGPYSGCYEVIAKKKRKD